MQILYWTSLPQLVLLFNSCFFSIGGAVNINNDNQIRRRRRTIGESMDCRIDKNPSSASASSFLVENDAGPRCSQNNPFTVRIELEFEGDELCSLGNHNNFSMAILKVANHRLCSVGCTVDTVHWEFFSIQDFFPSKHCTDLINEPLNDDNGRRRRRLQSSKSVILGIGGSKCNEVCPSELLPITTEPSRSLFHNNDQSDFQSNEYYHNHHYYYQPNGTNERRENYEINGLIDLLPSSSSSSSSSLSCGSHSSIVKAMNEFGYNVKTLPKIKQKVVTCDNTCPYKQANQEGTHRIRRRQQRQRRRRNKENNICLYSPGDDIPINTCPEYNNYGNVFERSQEEEEERKKKQSKDYSSLCFGTLECCGVPKCLCDGIDDPFLSRNGK